MGAQPCAPTKFLRMFTILLTGGRAPAALELARIFHAAGHRVLMAESAPYHLSEPSRAIERNFRVPPPRQQSAAYLDALKRIVIEHEVDLLIPTCEEIFYVSMGRDMLAQHCTVFVEPIERLRPLHNKWMFACRAQEYGLAVPETMLIETLDDLHDTFARWDALVLKPAYSRFASQTIICPADFASVSHLNITPDASWVAQRFIEGQQICTFSIVHNGKIAAHTAYRSEFTAGQGATIVFCHEDHPSALGWVEQFVMRERFTGQIAFDFIEAVDGSVVALECNPRATSGVHLFALTPQFPQAFFDGSTASLTPQSAESYMLIIGMLVFGMPAAIKNHRLREWSRALIHSRDVVFNSRDPLPALLQWRGIAYFIRLGRQHSISPLEASTLDIEWNGESYDVLSASVGRRS